jgi:rhodanese-related sulfurtransferase
MDLATITRDELKRKMDRGDRFVLVDVLEPATYGRERLPRAVNIPWGHVAELAPRVIPDKSAEVVVYCSSPT